MIAISSMVEVNPRESKHDQHIHDIKGVCVVEDLPSESRSGGYMVEHGNSLYGLAALSWKTG